MTAAGRGDSTGNEHGRARPVIPATSSGSRPSRVGTPHRRVRRPGVPRAPACPPLLREQSAQPLHLGRLAGLGEGCLGDEAVKAVEAAGPYVEFGDFAGLPQAGGVGDDLVAERLGRADVEEGRGVARTDPPRGPGRCTGRRPGRRAARRATRSTRSRWPCGPTRRGPPSRGVHLAGLDGDFLGRITVDTGTVRAIGTVVSQRRQTVQCVRGDRHRRPSVWNVLPVAHVLGQPFTACDRRGGEPGAGFR